MFKDGEFDEARQEYENALGMFNYIQSTDKDWQKKDLVMI